MARPFVEQEYLDLLKQRKAAGESWPSPSELRRDLGGGQDRAVQEQRTRVCVVAWQVIYKRPTTPGSALMSATGVYPKRPYVLVELIYTVCDFHKAVRFWPTLWEYLAWAEMQRRKERRKEVDVDPRLPS